MGFLDTYRLATQSGLINTFAIIILLITHASANVLNDYYDDLNGSDLNNVERISPFTGGSRLIQTQALSVMQTKALGWCLLNLAIVLGLYLCYLTTWKLIPIGILGILIAWSYSAPPLQLMSRGILGEIAVAIAWSLVVIGYALLQTGFIEYNSMLIAIAYGLIVANILFLNQVPDIKADQSAHKNTLATQSAPTGLWKWYLTIFVGAYLCQFVAIYCHQTNSLTLLTILAFPAFGSCALKLKKSPLDRSALKKIIPRNILGAHLYALLMCAGLFWGR